MTTNPVTLPRLPGAERAPKGTVENYLHELVEALEKAIKDGNRPAGRLPYDPQNVTHNPVFDASAATLDETRQALGTLMYDMKKRGFLG